MKIQIRTNKLENITNKKLKPKKRRTKKKRRNMETYWPELFICTIY